MTNDELRAMCERAIQHGIGGELRWIVMELLARLDAEAAMLEHGIEVVGHATSAEAADTKLIVLSLLIDDYCNKVNAGPGRTLEHVWVVIEGDLSCALGVEFAASEPEDTDEQRLFARVFTNERLIGFPHVDGLLAFLRARAPLIAAHPEITKEQP